jgi:hypothetical protein
VIHSAFDLPIADAATRLAADDSRAGDLADVIADLLNREADLRGID